MENDEDHVTVTLTRKEADSLLDAVAWLRYHSNDIYPGVASIHLFKAHIALDNKLNPWPSSTPPLPKEPA